MYFVQLGLRTYRSVKKIPRASNTWQVKRGRTAQRNHLKWTPRTARTSRSESTTAAGPKARKARTLSRETSRYVSDGTRLKSLHCQENRRCFKPAADTDFHCFSFCPHCGVIASEWWGGPSAPDPAREGASGQAPPRNR